MRKYWLLAALFGLSACGSAQTTTTPEAAADEVKAASSELETAVDELEEQRSASGFNLNGPPPAPWDELEKKIQGDYMEEVIMPVVKPLFAEFDHEKYERVTCATCHGPNPMDKGFAMPNPDLAVLPAMNDGAAWGKLAQEEAEMFDFMAKDLTPAVAQLLGKTVFNPGTGEGEFGCTSCHTLADSIQ